MFGLLPAIFLRLCIGIFVLVSFASLPAKSQNIHRQRLKNMAQSEFISWVNVPIIINAVKEQNRESFNFSLSQIEKLDRQWRIQRGSISRPMIDKILENPISKYLQSIQSQSNGLYREIILMDSNGLNVAQTTITTDYWQGDEPKFLQSFKNGVNGMYIGDVEYDDSAEAFVSHVAIAISEGDTPIGAISVAVDTEQFEF